MKHNGYFEGIVQLRNPNDELISFTLNVIEKSGASVAKIEEVTNGIDIYISSKKILRSLGSKLQNSFSGHMELSKKIHTRNKQTSKDVYRINLLFRLLPFKRGDLITHRGELLKIMSIGNSIKAKDPDTGKTKIIHFKDL